MNFSSTDEYSNIVNSSSFKLLSDKRQNEILKNIKSSELKAKQEFKKDNPNSLLDKIKKNPELMGFAAGSIFGVGSGIKITKKLSINFPKNNLNDIKPSALIFNKTKLSKAQSANARASLDCKLRALQKAQLKSVKVEILPDYRVRYYMEERFSKNPGPTRGSSHVTEYNPNTGQVRAWSECYDHNGKVNRIHPKMIDGQQIHGQHYPPTKKELSLFSKKSRGPK